MTCISRVRWSLSYSTTVATNLACSARSSIPSRRLSRASTPCAARRCRSSTALRTLQEQDKKKTTRALQCIHALTRVCVFPRADTHAHTHTRTRTCTHTHTHTHTHANANAHRALTHTRDRHLSAQDKTTADQKGAHIFSHVYSCRTRSAAVASNRRHAASSPLSSSRLSLLAR